MSRAPRRRSGPRVLVTSDSQVLMEGVAATLRAQGLTVAGGTRRLDALRVEHVDGIDAIIVAPANGMTTELLPLLHERVGAIPALVMLPDTGLRIHAEALKAADVACLPLTASAEEIAATIAQAITPQPGPATVAETVVRGLGGTLTSREQESLDAAAQGLTNGEIAERMGVSVETTKSHMANIYKKLGVSNRAQAVAAYLEAR